MRRTWGSLTLAAALVGLLTAWPLAAKSGDQAHFDPVDYQVRLDGSEIEAEVWQSHGGEMLIQSDALSAPVRLVLREARAETVQFMKVVRRSDSELVILPDASERALGTFKVSADGQGVSFAMDGRSIELKQKPSLLGVQGLEEMKAYSRDYVRKAADYKPSVPFLDRLRSESRNVRVEVFFGSWCGACATYVPRLIRVADELAGSNIAVDFYGLPRPPAFGQDPRAKALNITGVPTAVVYVDGKEHDRLVNNDWKIPELSLNRILVARSTPPPGR